MDRRWWKVRLFPESFSPSVKISKESKQPRIKIRGIAASGYARPTSSDNFIYGLKPVELRQNTKGETG